MTIEASLPEADISRIFNTSLSSLSTDELRWLLTYLAESAHQEVRPHLIRALQNLIADRLLRDYMGQQG